MSMSASLTHDILHGPPPPIDTGWGGGDHGSGRGASRAASFTGLFVLLAASTMAFAAFTSAFVVRRGLSDMDDWTGVHYPPVLFLNTVILLGSSFVLDLSRRALKAGDRSKFNFCWSAATALGILFLRSEERRGGSDWSSDVCSSDLLLGSSFVLDLSRRALKAGDRSKFNFCWSAATALGILFL